MNKILVLGDSHTHVLKRAKKLSNNQDWKNNFSINTFSKQKNGKTVGDVTLNEAKTAAAMLDASDLLVSMVGGNQYNSLGLIQHPTPFDVAIGSYDDKCELIPYGLLYKTFYVGMKGNDFQRITDIIGSCRSRIIHIPAPPPKEDEEHILTKPESDFVKNGIATFGVTPARTRLKLWEMQMTVSKDLCHEIGIEFINYPDFAINERGFLKEEFYGSDATHANDKCGEQVLAFIQKLS
jgi:hypothetical protein